MLRLAVLLICGLLFSLGAQAAETQTPAEKQKLRQAKREYAAQEDRKKSNAKMQKKWAKSQKKALNKAAKAGRKSAKQSKVRAQTSR